MVPDFGFRYVGAIFGCYQCLREGCRMTQQDIRNAIEFMERLFVGVREQDKFFKTLNALKAELKRRNK